MGFSILLSEASDSGLHALSKHCRGFIKWARRLKNGGRDVPGAVVVTT
jgi:hypothetical protein